MRRRFMSVASGVVLLGACGSDASKSDPAVTTSVAAATSPTASAETLPTQTSAASNSNPSLEEVRDAVEVVAGEQARSFVLKVYSEASAGMDTGFHVVTSFTDDAAVELCQVVNRLGVKQVIVEGVDGEWRANTEFSGVCAAAG